jgi:hypothetical protein
MNAKDELVKAIGSKKIKCAIIYPYANEDFKHDSAIELKINHSKDDLDEFLHALDFVYINKFGHIAEIDGIVWVEDCGWFSRKEYDGFFSWEFHNYPQIPNELTN